MRQLVWAGIFCLWLAGAVGAVAQTPVSISVDVARVEIKHVGPAATGDDYIRAQLRLKPGDRYTPTATDDDIHNLYSTGLFYNVQVSEEMTPDGVVVTYILQGKPRLTEISVKGNSYIKTSKIMKKVTSKVGEPLDERKLFTDSRAIQEMYEKKGYPGTQVKYVRYIDDAAGRGTVVFEITETPKIKITEVAFDGAEAFPQKKLRKVVKTRKRWWLSWLTGSGRFKEEQFEQDKMKLEDFYVEQGYLDFDIKEVRFEFPTTNTMVIHFDITEGTQYEVGSVTVEGAKIFATNTIERLLKQSPGTTFTPGGLRGDVQAIEDFYGSKGYIDVTASSRNLDVQKIPNTETGTIDLNYSITEGQKSYIEKIEIRGNTKTRDKVIRRELAVSPGEVFDTVGTRISRARLEGLDYFSKVDLRPEPTTIPNRKNLVVGVDEKNTGNMSMGAGFSSVDALVGFVEFTQANFDIARPPHFQGGGQKLRLRLQLGTERQDYSMQFVEPWFLGRKLEFSLDLYYRELGFQSLEGLYDESRGGGRIGFRRPLWNDFFVGGIAYTLENVGIINVSDNAPDSIIAEEGFSLLSEMALSLSYDTRRGIGLPNHGQRTELIASLTGGPLGGTQDFYKLELRTAWYFPGLFKGHVLEIVGRTGVAEQYGGSDDVPFYEKYYLGGLYTLRGYDYRGVGPREPTQDGSSYEPIGGKTYWFGSAEYSIPIIERLRLAVFYDIGMVYPDAYSFSPQPSMGPGFNTGFYNDDWGVGVRINLPIGPLRLDYAIPITDDEYNQGSGRFQFGVGYTREF